MRRAEGFTLIELMIVVAIIAIIAAIAIPNLLSARLSANEAAAVSTLRTISTSQAQFQSKAKADLDYDGTGEYGCFRELSAAWDVRRDSSIGKIAPPVLSGAFRNGRSDAPWVIGNSGYLYTIWLAQSDGRGVCPDQGDAAIALIDTDLAETTWCCYAWPSLYGNSGNRTFCINQSGDIITTDDRRYSGSEPPAFDPAMAFKTSMSESITGSFAVGTAGYNGNIWRLVN